MLVLNVFWELTLLIRFWFMLSGGWKGLLCLRDSIMGSDFAGLNDTRHLTAQACILAKIAFSSSAYGVIYNNIGTSIVSEKPYARMYIIYNTINICEKKDL